MASPDTLSETPEAASAQVEPDQQGPPLSATLQLWVSKYALFLAWAIFIVVFSILRPNVYPTLANLSSILGTQSVLVFLALGLMIPLIAGDFDLSVASTLTLSSLTVAVLNGQQGMPIGVAVLAAIVVGLITGLANGLLTVYVGIDSFIATLGVGTMVGGISLWISDGATVGGVSQSLVSATIGGKILGIPAQFYYGIGFALLLWYALRFMPFGRRLLIAGRNREVARLSGIAVGRMRIGAFMFSGFCGAIAGILAAGTSGAADPLSGAQLLLPGFAAAFLGATAISPGRFNVWGTVASVYFLVSGITGLQLLGVGSFVQDLFYGATLIIAVGLSIVVSRSKAVSRMS